LGQSRYRNVSLEHRGWWRGKLQLAWLFSEGELFAIVWRRGYAVYVKELRDMEEQLDANWSRRVWQQPGQLYRHRKLCSFILTRHWRGCLEAYELHHLWTRRKFKSELHIQ